MLLFTDADARTTAYAGAGAVVGGPVLSALVAHFLDPRQSLVTRLVFGVPATAMLALGATLVQTRIPGTPSWSFAAVTGVMAATALAGIGPMANALARRYFLRPERARRASTSGWVNGLLVYGFTAFAGQVDWWGSLAATLAVWLLSTLALCRLSGTTRPRPA
ncbi:hypothetical protein [Kitasatospora sp. NPDC050463]|uniref:hypothetical protein n=1 Tax=Kitasatospora sp. NPDC050463 TaxID=3155786 RepID=UPI0033D4B2AD